MNRRLRASGHLAVVLVIASTTACGGDDAEPARERPASRAATATATAAHSAGLRVRARRACLDGAGIPSTVRRRAPDDDDAPDVRLFLKSHVTALVGLYKDVRRARRYEPMVRANLKSVNGLVERRGNVTIGWIGRPGAELRRTVQRCLFTGA